MPLLKPIDSKVPYQAITAISPSQATGGRMRRLRGIWHYDRQEPIKWIRRAGGPVKKAFTPLGTPGKCISTLREFYPAIAIQDRIGL
jgi:hypothetical protein